MAPFAPSIREVWASNLKPELQALLQTIQDAGPGALLAIDTEFPGVFQEDAWKKSSEVQYRAMRDSVGLLPPIQLGLAVGSADAQPLAAWTFNLHFNLKTDLFRSSSVRFLTEAGIDFDRHAKEGIHRQSLGEILRTSLTPTTWLTFSGLYDLGYMLLLSNGGSLPQEREEFQEMLSERSAGNVDLRDWLPFGSLSALARQHGLERQGAAHTAGSDALLTLQLFQSLQGLSSDEEPADEGSVSADTIPGPLPMPPLPAPTLPPAAAEWGRAALAAVVQAPKPIPARDSVAPSACWGPAARSAVESRLFATCCA